MNCPRCGSQINSKQDVCGVCSFPLLNPGKRDVFQGGEVLLDRYRVVKLLEKGGMGTIYLGEDQRLDRNIVIKELASSRMDPIKRQKMVDWFEREARVLCALRHPNIPVVIDFFNLEEKFYLVMDYVEGTPLHKEQLPMDEGRVREFALVALDILDYLHENGIIHRDIKTDHFIQNRETGEIFLVDFGTARFIQPGKRSTAIGTPGFTPPEQYEGKADARSDIYALGATLHHLLTGIDPTTRTPFQFEPVGEIVDGVSPRLAFAVDRALEYYPYDRFQSAREMKKFLENEKLEPGQSFRSDIDILLNEPEYEDYRMLRRKPTTPIPAHTTGKRSARGKLIQRFRMPGGAWLAQLCFISPGEILAAATYQQGIVLKEAATGDNRGVLKRTTYSSAICTDLAASPDGTLLAQGMDSNEIIIWDVVTYRKLGKLLGHGRSIIRLLFLDNSTLVSSSEDDTIRIWDIKKLKESIVIDRHQSPVISLAAPEDGSFILAGTREGKIYSWKLLSANKYERLATARSAHKNGVRDLDVSLSGIVLSVGGDGKLKLWKVEGPYPFELKPFSSATGHRGSINRGLFVPGLDLFITGGDDKLVKIWDADSATSFLTLKDLEQPIKAITVSQNCRFFAAGGEKGDVVIWQM